MPNLIRREDIGNYLQKKHLNVYLLNCLTSASEIEAKENLKIIKKYITMHSTKNKCQSMMYYSQEGAKIGFGAGAATAFSLLAIMTAIVMYSILSNVDTTTPGAGAIIPAVLIGLPAIAIAEGPKALAFSSAIGGLVGGIAGSGYSLYSKKNLNTEQLDLMLELKILAEEKLQTFENMNALRFA